MSRFEITQNSIIKLFLGLCVVVYLYLYYLETQNNRYYVSHDGTLIIDKQSGEAFATKDWYNKK